MFSFFLFPFANFFVHLACCAWFWSVFVVSTSPTFYILHFLRLYIKNALVHAVYSECTVDMFIIMYIGCSRSSRLGLSCHRRRKYSSVIPKFVRPPVVSDEHCEQQQWRTRRREWWFRFPLPLPLVLASAVVSLLLPAAEAKSLARAKSAAGGTLVSLPNYSK